MVPREVRPGEVRVGAPGLVTVVELRDPLAPLGCVEPVTALVPPLWDADVEDKAVFDEGLALDTAVTVAALAVRATLAK